MKKKPMKRSELGYNVIELRFAKTGLAVSDLPSVGRVARTLSDRLDHYEARGAISNAQWQAGLHFQMDFERGGISGAPSAGRWEKQSPSHSAPQDAQVQARQRWRQALTELGDIGTSCAYNVCCQNMSASDWAHSKGERKEYGMGRLREALDVLIEFYGVTTGGNAA